MKAIECKSTGAKFQPIGSTYSLQSALQCINERCYISGELCAEECGNIGRLQLYKVTKKESGAVLNWKVLKRAGRFLIGY